MPLFDIGHSGLAHLDENIFNTWQSGWGTPLALVGHKMRYVSVDEAVDAGPGAFVAPDILERGYNAWYGAPGYYVGAPGVDRTIPDQHVHFGDYQPQIMQRVGAGGNPWDWIFGTIGSYGHDQGIGVRDWPNQSGEYSNS
jgi:hypothetical protein